jgi:hypothetical protein
MNTDEYKDLVRNARELYMMAQKMQKLMLDMFFDEFIDLDDEEQKICMQSEELPF